MTLSKFVLWSLLTCSCPSLYGMTPQFCANVLKGFANSKEGLQPRPIDYRFVARAIPEAKGFEVTLNKFENWSVRSSGIEEDFENYWNIYGVYRQGPVSISVRKDGVLHHTLSVWVKMEAESEYDPRINELFFLLSSVLSEAKVALGVKEQEVAQLSAAEASSTTIRPPHEINASFHLETAATLGKFSPVPKAEALSFKFVEILISKLEQGQFSGKPDWVPREKKNERMIKAGKTVVYFRKVPNSEGDFDRVHVSLGNRFMFEFIKTAKPFPQFTPHFRGEIDGFVDRFIGDLRAAGARLAPTFRDANGQEIDISGGFNFFFDVPVGTQDPVDWVVRHFRTTLEERRIR